MENAPKDALEPQDHLLSPLQDVQEKLTFRKKLPSFRQRKAALALRENLLRRKQYQRKKQTKS